MSKIRVHVDTCPIEHGPWPYAVLHAGLGKLVPGPFCSAGGEEETQKERQEEGHICSASLSLSIRDIRKPPQNELNRHFRLVLKPTVEILAEHYRTCLDKKKGNCFENYLLAPPTLAARLVGSLLVFPEAPHPTRSTAIVV